MECFVTDSLILSKTNSVCASNYRGNWIQNVIISLMGDSGWVSGSLSRQGRKMLISSTHDLEGLSSYIQQIKTFKIVLQRCGAHWSCYCSLFLQKVLRGALGESGQRKRREQTQGAAQSIASSASHPAPGKTPCLPRSWSLTGTPGTILDVRVGKLNGDNDHSHSEHPAKNSTHRNPDTWWYLSHLGSSRF